MGSRAADRKCEKAKKVRFLPSSYYSRTGTRTVVIVLVRVYGMRAGTVQ